MLVISETASPYSNLIVDDTVEHSVRKLHKTQILTVITVKKWINELIGWSSCICTVIKYLAFEIIVFYTFLSFIFWGVAVSK